MHEGMWHNTGMWHGILVTRTNACIRVCMLPCVHTCLSLIKHGCMLHHHGWLNGHTWRNRRHGEHGANKHDPWHVTAYFRCVNSCVKSSTPKDSITWSKRCARRTNQSEPLLTIRYIYMVSRTTIDDFRLQTPFKVVANTSKHACRFHASYKEIIHNVDVLPYKHSMEVAHPPSRYAGARIPIARLQPRGLQGQRHHVAQRGHIDG